MYLWIFRQIKCIYYLSIYIIYIKKRDLYHLVHLRKITDSYRAKERLNKGVEEKKAMAIAERHRKVMYVHVGCYFA